jgi:hypothetical protein
MREKELYSNASSLQLARLAPVRFLVGLGIPIAKVLVGLSISRISAIDSVFTFIAVACLIKQRRPV